MSTIKNIEDINTSTGSQLYSRVQILYDKTIVKKLDKTMIITSQFANGDKVFSDMRQNQEHHKEK